ncbi:OsmC family protein [Pedobacter sp. SYSU D00535]|uniref:OsmC family protein n=1 Tax=Pedobacter sp. SYSU D00535 TaxID=2810308 RepID=UPI001A96366C|nr:OsmC family protein [Pedobacter sp. SYSU D00535]
MATSQVTYLGDLRTEATHLQSGERIITDAPVDNKGRGEAFSPTDLLATSLGNCMLTIMGIAARERGINIDGTTCSITKIMAADPRRVSEIHAEIDFSANYSEKERSILEHAARTCPVFYSLHPEIKKEIKFNYPVA